MQWGKIQEIKDTEYFRSLPGAQALAFERILRKVDDRRKRLQFFGSQENIAKEIGKSIKPVRTIITKLKSDGVLIQVPNAGNTVNIYNIDLSIIFNSELKVITTEPEVLPVLPNDNQYDKRNSNKEDNCIFGKIQTKTIPTDVVSQIQEENLDTKIEFSDTKFVKKETNDLASEEHVHNIDIFALSKEKYRLELLEHRKQLGIIKNIEDT